MRDLLLIVDGAPFENLEAGALHPVQFDYQLASGDNYYSCNGYEGLAGKVGPLYLTGYYALLPPPSAGRHDIEYGGTYSDPTVDHVQRILSTFIVE